MSDDDPLDGADVGETVTLTETSEIWVGDLESPACRGSDRLADSRVANVTERTDEYGDTILEVTVESDVTKRLPHRWDTCREPRTEDERAAARRSVWADRVFTAVSLLVPLGIATVVSTRVLNAVSGEITMNGEPMVFPAFTELIWPVLLVVLLAFIITGVGRGHLPRGYGGRAQ